MIPMLTSLAGTLLLGLAALFAPPPDALAQNGNGNGPGQPGDPPGITVPLSDAEEADLLFMREEEKLARDVYNALYDLWGLPVFRNIAAAEQTHMNSVLRLLNRYGLPDPVGDNPPGVFTDPALQAMYDDLISQGSASATAALQVGVAIEQADIADLQDALTRADHRDIARVYRNLLRGSQRHLAAFTRCLP